MFIKAGIGKHREKFGSGVYRLEWIVIYWMDLRCIVIALECGKEGTPDEWKSKGASGRDWIFSGFYIKNLPRNETKEKVIKYAKEHGVDQTVIMTVAGAANCKIDYRSLAAKGDGDMCTLFDEIAKENEAKGIVETGFDFGISEKDILERLQNKLRIPLKKAQEYLELYGKQTV